MTLIDRVHFTGAAAKTLGDAVLANAAAGIRAHRQARHSRIHAAVTTYDPLDPATAAQPYEAYRRLHENGRVHYNPKRSLWILSCLDDVRAAARDGEALSSADGVTRTKISLPILVTTDGEKHAQMRRQVLPAFTKAALESWRPMIDRLATEMVGEVLDNPGCDVVQRLAVPMPVRLIAHLLGIPDDDVDDFRRWSEASVQVTDLALTPRGVQRLGAALSGSWSMNRYFRQQIRRRRPEGLRHDLGQAPCRKRSRLSYRGGAVLLRDAAAPCRQ